MRATLISLACAASLALLPGPASANQRVKYLLVGGAAGAVVGGPVGAVAGGAIGYTAGPRIAHTVKHRHHVRHHRVRRVSHAKKL
ncbi:MAG: hypothetical protein ACJ8AS_06895 [Hyphomicrobiales bacterium]